MNHMFPNISPVSCQVPQIVTPAYLAKRNYLDETSSSKNNDKCLFTVCYMPNIGLRTTVD